MLLAICCHPNQAVSTHGNNTQKRSTINEYQLSILNRLKHSRASDDYHEIQNDLLDDTIDFNDYAKTQNQIPSYYLEFFLLRDNTEKQPNSNAYRKRNKLAMDKDNNIAPGFKREVNVQLYKNFIDKFDEVNNKDRNNNAKHSFGSNKEKKPKSIISNPSQNVVFDGTFTLFFVGLMVSTVIVVVRKLKN